MKDVQNGGKVVAMAKT
ncbi:hypothetical protein CGCSCA4_v014903 [Colletotrichum siamense]|uniref:Uncharacterized protein n=1 Tax=Colletotrichum siamense TaxID=690259 RepID=A0A9P5EEA5_COLSI|nr:hypothetical protein CGCSCA4_v014903 [Colletotrichum siamense]KAF4846129.1 hypothetical protein CGCSCA2_v013253 [Colletotrichum siamense]